MRAQEIHVGTTFYLGFETGRSGEPMTVSDQHALQIPVTLVRVKCVEVDDADDKLCEVYPGGPRFALSANGRVITALDNMEDEFDGVLAGTRTAAYLTDVHSKLKLDTSVLAQAITLRTAA